MVFRVNLIQRIPSHLQVVVSLSGVTGFTHDESSFPDDDEVVVDERSTVFNVIQDSEPRGR